MDPLRLCGHTDPITLARSWCCASQDWPWLQGIFLRVPISVFPGHAWLGYEYAPGMGQCGEAGSIGHAGAFSGSALRCIASSVRRLSVIALKKEKVAGQHQYACGLIL